MMPKRPLTALLTSASEFLRETLGLLHHLQRLVESGGLDGEQDAKEWPAVDPQLSGLALGSAARLMGGATSLARVARQTARRARRRPRGELKPGVRWETARLKHQRQWMRWRQVHPGVERLRAAELQAILGVQRATVVEWRKFRGFPGPDGPRHDQSYACEKVTAFFQAVRPRVEMHVPTAGTAAERE